MVNLGPIHWKRVIVSVLLGEVIPILVLVLFVALLGPSETGQAEAFARQAGAWVGPIAGAVALLFAVSNGGKVLAAMAGGWFSLKAGRAEAPDPSS